MGRYSNKSQLEGLFLKLINNCLLCQIGKMGILYAFSNCFLPPLFTEVQCGRYYARCFA